MLSGGKHTYTGAAASCVAVCPCRVSSRSASKQIYRSGSENLLISWTIWEWSLYSPGSAGRDLPKAAWLFRPEMPMALSGLRCQRRRWHASCGMQRERRSPCRLMYATAAVLSVRTSSSLPQKRPLRRFKARRTANNSRQLMCQCSWVPVQTPDTACPSCVALQPVVEGHYCLEKRKVLPRGEGLTAGWCD